MSVWAIILLIIATLFTLLFLGAAFSNSNGDKDYEDY